MKIDCNSGFKARAHRKGDFIIKQFTFRPDVFLPIIFFYDSVLNLRSSSVTIQENVEV
jgi:hypothetical protein